MCSFTFQLFNVHQTFIFKEIIIDSELHCNDINFPTENNFSGKLTTTLLKLTVKCRTMSESKGDPTSCKSY